MENFRTNVKCKWVDNELIVARRNRMARIAVQQSKTAKHTWCISISDPAYSALEILNIYKQTGEIIFVPN